MTDRHAPPPLRRLRRGAALATALAVCTGGLALGAGPATARAAAAPEPRLHWTLDALEGSTVPDASGNGLDGTLSGSAELVEGQDGQALDLRGGTVSIPRGAIGQEADLTVSTRFRWSGEGGNWQWLYGLGSGTDRYLFQTPSSGDGTLRTSVTAGGEGGEAQVPGWQPAAAGEWVTLTTTLDATADRLTTYVDGVELGSAPTTVSAQDLLTDQATVAGSLGGSFYPDPAFRGAVDAFRVYGAALTAGQVAEVVGDDLPTVEALERTTFEVRTRTGQAPTLPASTRATFDDGYDRAVPIAWDEVDPAAYAGTGSFEVAGTAAGEAVTARVDVNRGELRVDLGETTGDVHGGASGVLYGLYGDGMPSDELLEGMNVRSVATKAQDGSQHPGSDALEILGPLTRTTDGDVYMRIVDWYRGFPYQWPGDTPEAKMADFRVQLDAQLEKIATLPDDQRANLVIEPFNEPEGNTFGTGEWSYDRTSWLDDPTDYFAAWDETYRTIKAAYPDMRVAGPGTSVLFPQVRGFLDHTVAEGTVPDIITWHELTHPQAIRDSVEQFRGWEAEAFAGSAYAGRETPININEYAFNYHTSVPGQMVQWMSAIEDSKVDAMIAFWNINGNLSDSAVQSDRANGQWWLYNAYAQLSGQTVAVTPPQPGENYSLQGLASLDEDQARSRVLLGGASGDAPVDVVDVPEGVFGDQVRAWVREIPWTGQLGDSAQPRTLSERVLPVVDGSVSFDFGAGDLPELKESSAYEIVITPAGAGEVASTPATAWDASYEAEDAAISGSGWSVNGPEGSPADVGKFYTSGGLDVGGLRTGSDVAMDFTVDVPEDGSYDLSVFANSLNTFERVQEQGPTNVFLTVDGGAEQELFLPLAYKWVVWDHADTTVDLTAGEHVVTLSARSLDGSGATVGDALVDRITLALPSPTAGTDVYEAELADLDGGRLSYGGDEVAASAAAPLSGSGAARLGEGDTATFWVYGERDAEATMELAATGTATVALNGAPVLSTTEGLRAAVAVRGGVNKVVVTGGADGAIVDRLTVSGGTGALERTELQAEDGTLAGTATVQELSLAEGGAAVSSIGGEPGNGNMLTLDVEAAEAGPHAVVIRYSNPEQVPATHYNPNPMARHADISVNGGAAERVLFPPTFHENAFFERTLVLDLVAGANTLTFAAEEQPNWDGTTYAGDTWPGIPLRADQAPIIDRLSVSPLSAVLAAEPAEPGDPTEPGTPGDPGDPTEPGTPGDPGDPTEPGTPGEPGDPTEPGTPVDPTEPGAPGDGTGSGSGSGRDDGPSATAADRGPLAMTGSTLAGVLLAAGLLLATAGTGLVLRRRRGLQD
ncbi:LamG-like jellyroll fold domain-containing protein [Frigoribacterium salinisoli]